MLGDHHETLVGAEIVSDGHQAGRATGDHREDAGRCADVALAAQSQSGPRAEE